MKDSEIIDLFLTRNQNAIVLTSEKYGKSLRKIALNICNDFQAAEECENDTYLTAWNSIPPHEPREYLFAFLAKIIRSKAINRVISMSRQKRKADFVELSEELTQCFSSDNNVDSVIDEKELSRIISNFLRTISDEKRNIFIRRYWYMDSIPDISKLFSVSEGKVKSTLFRTRNELKNYLRNEGYEI